MSLNQPVGIPFQNPTDYTGPRMNIVPIRRFPREPTTTDRRYRIGQQVIIGRNPTSGTEGELWYLSRFESNGDATWVQFDTGTPGVGIDSLLTDDGPTAVGPTLLGVVSVLGGTGMTTSGQDPSNTVTITLDIPVIVANGGTGATSLTDNAVLVGSGTAAITAITVGLQGQVLVGVGSADPAFNFTVAGDGDFTYVTENTGTTKQFLIQNSDTTTAGSFVNCRLLGGGTSSGAVWNAWEKGSARSWALGMPTTGSEQLVIHTTNAAAVSPASGTEVWHMTTAGERTMALQPAFLAFLPTSDLNASGDGTTYTIGGTTALTEVFDQNADFNTNGTFTAPVTGRYYFSAVSVLTGGTDISGSVTTIVASNRSLQRNGPNGPSAITNTIPQIAGFVDMDSADTVTITLQTVDSGGLIDDVIGSASPYVTWMGGFLAC